MWTTYLMRTECSGVCLHTTWCTLNARVLQCVLLGAHWMLLRLPGYHLPGLMHSDVVCLPCHVMPALHVLPALPSHWPALELRRHLRALIIKFTINFATKKRDIKHACVYNTFTNPSVHNKHGTDAAQHKALIESSVTHLLMWAPSLGICPPQHKLKARLTWQ